MHSILYHGSNAVVEKPHIITDGNYKDFGYGFYCITIEKQAVRWANTKKGESVLNKYRYAPNEKLKVLIFEEMTEEWLDFIVSCRHGDKHDYDIVEGPMADDTVWDYVEEFVDGLISREAFWVLVKFKYPTHQMAFCTQEALETISFEGSEDCEE